MKITHYLSIFGLILTIFSGCTSPYPKTLVQNPIIEKDTSIMLIGIRGSNAVHYLQFCSDFPPCSNYRFEPIKNDVIPLRVTVSRNYYFGVYSIGNAGYIVNGNSAVSYGYISAKSDIKAINKKGIYYFGTLNTDTETIDHSIDTKFIYLAKEKYKSLFKGLEPINFKWE